MTPFPQLRIAATAAAFALLASLSLAQTVDDSPKVKAEVLDRITTLLTQQAYVPGLDFGKWRKFSEEIKTKLDGSKNDDEFRDAMNEAFLKFGYSHISLRTPKGGAQEDSGRMVGIGIRQQKVDEGALVVRVFKGGAASKAGIVPGDTIVKVNGNPVDGIKGIAGVEGTTLVLSVKHADGKTADYTLTRTTFSTTEPEDLIEVDKDTARLVVPTFYLSYDPENVETLMKRAAKYKNLIVDLRDNGGGRVVNVQHLLGLLEPASAFGTFVDREMVRDYVEQTHGKETDVAQIAAWSRSEPRWRRSQERASGNFNVPIYAGHIAVLVNGRSGSGAEIAAAALHELVGAPVVGTKSAGAVLVSYIDPVSHGFSLEYPIYDYVTVKGLRIEGTGVTPTLKVDDPKFVGPTDKDPVVEKATALLETPVLSVMKP